MTGGLQEGILRVTVTWDSREDCPRGSVSEQSMELSISLRKNSLRVTRDVLRDLYTKRNSAQTMLCKKRKQW